MQNKELVILDLDGTIINGQSQLIFLKYLLKKRVISLFFYFKLSTWFILYKLSIIKNPKKIMQYAFSFLSKKKESEIETLINDFVVNYLKNFIFLEIINIIDKYKHENKELIIVSNSISPIVKKIAQFLEIKNYIATKLEVENGEFTGKILGDIIYGKNKIKYINNFIKEKEFKIENIWAYTDHISDIDILKNVNHPFVVNPKKDLLKEATKNSWPIIYFKKI
jgi:HAD superfamily hydrolase (TIGR01490 family)